MIARVSQPPAAAADPDLALLLATDRPFLERDLFRKTIKLLATDKAPKPILVVTGLSKSGKSYSSEYVDDFCFRRSGLSMSLQKLIPGMGSPTAADLAKDLVASMGRVATGMPPQATNADRWPLELANWVLVEGNQTNLNWWFCVRWL